MAYPQGDGGAGTGGAAEFERRFGAVVSGQSLLDICEPDSRVAMVARLDHPATGIGDRYLELAAGDDSRGDRHLSTGLERGDPVLDGVFDQRLNDQRRHGQFSDIGGHVDHGAQPFLEAGPLDRQI